MFFYYHRLGNAWDPLVYDHEEPSALCLHRVKQDIADFYAKPLAGVSIFPEENNVTKVHALVEGPPGTPYNGGLFHFLIKFSQDYPMTPPRVRFMTTDGGRVGFHTNLFPTGMVSLSILGKWGEYWGQQLPQWCPTLGLEQVLVWLQSLFFYKFAYEKDHYNFLQQETIRVAACGMVETALTDTSVCPQALRKHILKLFSDQYSKYVNIVRSNLHLTGRKVCCHFSDLQVREFRFEPLLQTLKGLEKRMKEKLEGSAGGGS